MNTILIVAMLLIAFCVVALCVTMGISTLAVTRSFRDSIENNQRNYEFLAAAAITVDPRRKDQLAFKSIPYPTRDSSPSPTAAPAPDTGMVYEEGMNL